MLLVQFRIVQIVCVWKNIHAIQLVLRKFGSLQLFLIDFHPGCTRQLNTGTTSA